MIDDVNTIAPNGNDNGENKDEEEKKEEGSTE